MHESYLREELSRLVTQTKICVRTASCQGNVDLAGAQLVVVQEGTQP